MKHYQLRLPNKLIEYDTDTKELKLKGIHIPEIKEIPGIKWYVDLEK